MAPSVSVHELLAQFVNALVEAIEKKDSYTGGHTKRVVHYAQRLALALQIEDPEQLERIRWGAMLHDVGKIGISDAILKKPSSLNEEEWLVMKEHPRLGEEILRRISGVPEIADAVLYHHERWDGSGYPEGRQGEDIPLVARIIAVADAYDAIVSTRPYRKGSSPASARQEIVAKAGTQFDPRIIEAFARAFADD